MTPEISMLLVAIVGALTGAFIGGGAVLVVTDRALKNVLNSPVLIANIEQLGKSFPPEVRDLLVDSGKLLEKVGGGDTNAGDPGVA